MGNWDGELRWGIGMGNWDGELGWGLGRGMEEVRWSGERRGGRILGGAEEEVLDTDSRLGSPMKEREKSNHPPCQREKAQHLRAQQFPRPAHPSEPKKAPSHCSETPQKRLIYLKSKRKANICPPTTVISDPDDPKFDLEAYLTTKMADEAK